MATRRTELDAILDSIRDTADFDMLELQGVNDRGSLGNTPLHIAAVRGDAPAINCLLDHGAAIDAIGEFGETALHVAVQMRHPEAVETLLARGASRDIENALGKTPLELARAVRSAIAKLFER
jgi:ankyrin repeat protein